MLLACICVRTLSIHVQTQTVIIQSIPWIHFFLLQKLLQVTPDLPEVQDYIRIIVENKYNTYNNRVVYATAACIHCPVFQFVQNS